VNLFLRVWLILSKSPLIAVNRINDVLSQAPESSLVHTIWSIHYVNVPARERRFFTLSNTFCINNHMKECFEMFIKWTVALDSSSATARQVISSEANREYRACAAERVRSEGNHGAKKWPSSACLSSPMPMTCARPHPPQLPDTLECRRARQRVRSRGQAGESTRL